MFLTPQTGAMTRHKAPRDIIGMKVLCRGRGLKDPNVMKLPAQLQGMLKAAMKDAAEKLKEDVNTLVWRVDRSGVIHITDTRIKVQ